MYVLKKIPEDFVVEEIANPDVKGSGPYLLLRVTKRSRNTEEVAGLLAKALRVPRKAIGYAGAKDRKALTTQYFTIKGKKAVKGEKTENVGVTIETLGYVEEPFALGLHTGNRFTITVRNLDGNEDLSLPRTVPNYFDEQRFSSDNARIGEALLKKRFLEAARIIAMDDGPKVREHLATHPNDAVGALMAVPRQLLRLYLHAYQSLLWNRALARSIKGERKVPYSLGEFVFPPRDTALSPIAIPLPGFSTADDPLLAPILKKEGLTPRDFVIRQLPNLSLEGVERAAFMDVKEFSASAFEDDEIFPGKKKTLLRFTLGKGSYATMLVKAMFA